MLALFGMRPLHFMLRPFGGCRSSRASGSSTSAISLGHGFAALRQPKLMVGALFLDDA